MAPKTPPAVLRAAVLVALALALASCGGGSIANPIAATGATTTALPPTASTPNAAPQTTVAPAAPRTTATAPRRAPRTSTRQGHGSGGAAPPEAPRQESPSAAPTTTARQVPDAPAAQPAGSPLDETAHLTLVDRVSPAHYFQTGTVTGTYDGTMQVEARITSKGVIVNFTATLPGGTIVGRAIAVAILDSTTWPALRGTAAVTGGTGRFAGIHGRGLKVSGRSKPDASKAHVRLAGTVSY